MKVAVCVKQIPDPAAPYELDPDTGDVLESTPIQSGRLDGVAALVTDQMLKIEGMISSETLIAFRAYSQHDLAAMFSIGLE